MSSVLTHARFGQPRRPVVSMVTSAARIDAQLAALAVGQPRPVVAFVTVVREAVASAPDPWAALDRIIELMQGDRTTLDHQLAAVADTRAMAATESDPQRRADRIALADHAQAVAVAGTAVHAVTTQMGAAL